MDTIKRIETEHARRRADKRERDAKYLTQPAPFTAPIDIHPDVLQELKKKHHVTRQSVLIPNIYPEYQSQWLVESLSTSA